MISKELLQIILEQYSLPWNGIHGLAHWARVLENGRRLAPLTGAKIEVVELFAIFHDAKRINEGIDVEHGYRGAEYAASLNGELCMLSNEDFDLLFTACQYHTDGLTAGDVTVQTCWDTDRLDLGRVGITPRQRFLCTPAAKDADLIAWAHERARHKVVPALIRTEWGA